MSVDLSNAPQDIQDGLSDPVAKFATHQTDRSATTQAAAKLDATQASAAAAIAADQAALATCQANENHSGAAVTSAIATLEQAIGTEFSDAPAVSTPPVIPGPAGT